jgi:hypothetical protein
LSGVWPEDRSSSSEPHRKWFEFRASLIQYAEKLFAEVEAAERERITLLVRSSRGEGQRVVVRLVTTDQDLLETATLVCRGSKPNYRDALTRNGTFVLGHLELRPVEGELWYRYTIPMDWLDGPWDPFIVLLNPMGMGKSLTAELCSGATLAPATATAVPSAIAAEPARRASEPTPVPVEVASPPLEHLPQAWRSLREALIARCTDDPRGPPDALVVDELNASIPNEVVFLLHTPHDTGQRVRVRLVPVDDAEHWVEIATVVCWEHELDCRDALIRNSQFDIGHLELRADHGKFWYRHSIWLEGLQAPWTPIFSTLKLVANRGQLLEIELTGDDKW